jgi:predicted homoserine dehydrogenase-like protein
MADAPRIGVAVLGTGFYGAGLLRRLALLPEFAPRLAANRSLERALAAYCRAGIPSERIAITNDLGEAQAALDAGRYVATTNLSLAARLRGIDVLAEATGDLLAGTATALAGLKAGKHVVAANADVQATVGLILGSIAKRAGAVYTDIEGDEPGLLNQLLQYCAEIGLEVVLAGSGKGVLKREATPDTQREFALRNRLQPWMATAAADGTKLNLELTVVANATGLVPAVRGMFGPAAEPEQLVSVAERLGLLDGGRYLDYLLGVRGVFALVKCDDPEVRGDFEYFKLGDGPYYVLYRPVVLAQYAAVRSIRRAARQGLSTVKPLGTPIAETVTIAKRDLSAGHRLDGVGGFDVFGLIERASEARRGRLLPVGIAQYARLCRPVRKGEPITYDHVEFDESNLALQLRAEQDALFGHGDPSARAPAPRHAPRAKLIVA